MLTWRVALVAGLLAAVPAFAQAPAIVARSGDHPGFGRIVFDLPTGVTASATQDGKQASVKLVGAGGINFGPLPHNVLALVPVSGGAEIALAEGLDGMIISNTTIARPPGLKSSHRGESGGLSGAPLLEPSTRVLADIYRLTRGRLPLIGVGGIASPDDAYAKIRAGASLIQLYTALVYQGPRMIRDINKGLVPLLRRDGFATLAQAVGADVAL